MAWLGLQRAGSPDVSGVQLDFRKPDRLMACHGLGLAAVGANAAEPIPNPGVLASSCRANAQRWDSHLWRATRPACMWFSISATGYNTIFPRRVNGGPAFERRSLQDRRADTLTPMNSAASRSLRYRFF